MTWEILWQPPSRRDLGRLDPPDQERVIEAVVRLARTGQGDVLRLTGVKPLEWRLRVGPWRVRFRRNDPRGVLEILRVLPRGKAY